MLFRRAGNPAISLQETLRERRLISNGQVITAHQSIQRVAVFAAANFIASTASQLPVSVYRGTGTDKRELPKSQLLSDPGGEGYGFSDWAWNVLFRALIQGNAVGIVTGRDSLGYPTGIQLKNLDFVAVGYNKDGRIEWKFDGKTVPTEDIFHFRAFPQEGKVYGLSPIGLHMQTVGIGIQAEEFGARFFADGAHPSAILTSAAKLDQTQAQIVKDRFLAAIRGTREPVVLPNDIKYQQIQINPLESQFLETQKYSAAECARIFGPGVPEMLGYETGGSMTYHNVEQRSIHVLTYTLNNWLRRLEGALSAQALTPRGQFVRFNRAGLLQSATLDRYKAFEIALKNQWQTVNEVREIEDLPPVDWGSRPVAPLTAPVAAPDNSNDNSNVNGGAQ